MLILSLSIRIVSIHASVKDATIIQFCHAMFIIVSIHASVKDATQTVARIIFYSGFQSTHL